ncbi:MAG: hypothetical protein B6D41_22085 [Chloroflexi bacterium UTCFX4]|nr:MAG: hypothetical protein B6D41_22085 [Chloroflexi bacterium UTCFX4]
MRYEIRLLFSIGESIDKSVAQFMVPVHQIAQFAQGKLIADGRDVRGFSIVARSSALPSDSVLEQIRGIANVGAPLEIGSYGGSDAALIVGEFAIAARFQRSPRESDRGYFLQEHYLLAPRDAFASLGNNYAYLLALLPPEIAWRSQDENLPLLAIPPRDRVGELDRAALILQQFGDQIYRALELVLNNQPFVINPTGQYNQVVSFLQTINLLLPPAARPHVTWALNVQNVKRCQARIKVIGTRTVGTESLNIIRLGATNQTPRADSSSVGGYYVSLLESYAASFGTTALLNLIEGIQFADNLAWQEILSQLGAQLYRVLGLPLLKKSLAVVRPPYEQSFVQQVIQLLEQHGATLSKQDYALCLSILVDGALNERCELKQVERVPREIGNCDEALFWKCLTPLFVEVGSPRDERRLTILQFWRNDNVFWQRSAMQQLLYQVLSGEVSKRAAQPSGALGFLRRMADRNLLPLAIDPQAGLLEQALAQSSQTSLRPDQLIETWAKMSANPMSAQRLAQTQPLATFLNQPEYGFIRIALNAGSPEQVENALGNRRPEDLDGMAELLLALALMGERLNLSGFRAKRILDTLRRYAERTSPTDKNPKLNQVYELLGKAAENLDPQSRQKLAEFLAEAGQFTHYPNLLRLQPELIRPLAKWLKIVEPNTPNYPAALNRALDWFSHRSAQIDRGDQSIMLQDFIEQARRFPQHYANQLILLSQLIFADAFTGNFKRRGSIFSERYVSKVGAGIEYMHKQFAQNIIPPQTYWQILETTFQQEWKRPEETQELIRELENRRLADVANLLRQRANAMYATAQVSSMSAPQVQNVNPPQTFHSLSVGNQVPHESSHRAQAQSGQLPPPQPQSGESRAAQNQISLQTLQKLKAAALQARSSQSELLQTLPKFEQLPQHDFAAISQDQELKEALRQIKEQAKWLGEALKWFS